MQSLVFLCILACPFSWGLAEHCSSQDKPSSEARDGYRFEVTDAESDVPVPEAEVTLAYLQKKGTDEVRKEIEVKTDKNGLAGFPKLEAYKVGGQCHGEGLSVLLALDPARRLERVDTHQA